MRKRWFWPSLIIAIPLLLVLLTAVACGGEDEPTPPPTSTTAAPTAVPPTNTPAPDEPEPTARPDEPATATPRPTATSAAPQPTAAPTRRAPGPTFTPTPTPPPTATPQFVMTPQGQFVREGKRGGVIPMHMPNTPTRFYIWECPSTSSCMSQSSPMFNGLIELNMETYQFADVRGDLAQSWTVADDGVTYTFKLHDAQWWDGMPVTAEDVRFSLDMMVNPDNPFPKTGQLRFVYDAGGSRVIDDKTVEVKIPRPSANFIPLLANQQMKMLPKHNVEKDHNLKLRENQVGSGPFIATEYLKDVSLRFERNDNYFKAPRPYFDGMIWHLMRDRNTIIAAFKTEQFLACSSSVCGLTPTQYTKLAEDLGDRMSSFSYPTGSNRFVIFNTNKEPWSDPRVRKAVSLAMNRQEYIAIVGGGTIGAPFLPDTHFYHSSEEQLQVPGYRVDANGEKLQEDIDAAKALLAEAGYPNGFETTLDAATIPTFVTIGQVVADQMKRYLNIDVRIKSPTYAAAQVNDWATGNFDMISFGTSFLLVDPDFINASLYLPGGERNSWGGGWHDEKVIDLSDRISKEGDVEQRKALTLELGAYLEEQSPQIGLAWSFGVGINNHKIKNYHPSTASNASVWHEHTWFEDNYTVIGDRP